MRKMLSTSILSLLFVVFCFTSNTSAISSPSSLFIEWETTNQNFQQLIRSKLDLVVKKVGHTKQTKSFIRQHVNISKMAEELTLGDPCPEFWMLFTKLHVQNSLYVEEMLNILKEIKEFKIKHLPELHVEIGSKIYLLPSHFRELYIQALQVIYKMEGYLLIPRSVQQLARLKALDIILKISYCQRFFHEFLIKFSMEQYPCDAMLPQIIAECPLFMLPDVLKFVPAVIHHKPSRH